MYLYYLNAVPYILFEQAKQIYEASLDKKLPEKGCYSYSLG